jgi:histidinol-phosphate aminotransferase
LKIQIAENLGVTAANIFLGNGSCEILALVIQTYAGHHDEVVLSDYVYALFETYIKAANARSVKAPAKNWGHDLDAMLACVTNKTKLVVIANPNNPTGTSVTHNEIKSFLTKLPSTILVLLDEAYYDYASEDDYPDSVALLKEFPNLMVTRTFSKAYALAGLRIGYAIADPSIHDYLNRVRLPFNVNSLGLLGASFALKDQTYLKNTVDFVRAEKKIMIAKLNELKLTYLPSAANFVAVHFNNADGVFQQLLSNGLLVRQLKNYAMPDHLRITIGSQDQNERLLLCLTELVKEGRA